MVCEGVVASLLPSSGSPPVQLLGGSPGHTLRIHFGQPLNLMEKCAARVQMQTEVQLSGGASLSVAESLIDALQVRACCAFA